MEKPPIDPRSRSSILISRINTASNITESSPIRPSLSNSHLTLKPPPSPKRTIQNENNTFTPKRFKTTNFRSNILFSPNSQSQSPTNRPVLTSLFSPNSQSQSPTNRPVLASLFSQNSQNQSPTNRSVLTTLNSPNSQNESPKNRPVLTTIISPNNHYQSLAESKRRCKCGSTNHSRTNHKDCILNKNNNLVHSNSDFNTTVNNVNTNTNSNICSHCGSSDHRRKSSYRCPFNPRNMASNIVFF